ncbi:MAG: trigger factor [Bacilli bacterium]
MERKLTKLEHCKTEVFVNFTSEEWKEAQKKAYAKLAKEVKIDGFRKGKAPENLIKKQIDEHKLMDEAINLLLPDAYKAIIEEDKVVPYARPEISVTKLSDTDLEVKFEITTAPEVKLGQYKDLNIGHQNVDVKEEEVDLAIEKLKEGNATLVLKEGAAALGDTVIIDFDGYVEGKAFEGGNAKNYELELGSGMFVPGFEEQCVGHKAGDAFDVEVTFPEKYVEHLANKKATFKTVIHEVKEKKVPELDENLIKELGLTGVNTLEELRKNKRAELEEQQRKTLKKAYLDKLLDEIAKNSTIEIPDTIIESDVEARRRDTENQMAQSGFSIEQYLEIIGQSEEEFLKTLRKESEVGVRNVAIIEEIAALEDIVIGEAELELEYAKIADMYKMKISEVKKALEPQKEQFRTQIRFGQTEDLLFKFNN